MSSHGIDSGIPLNAWLHKQLGFKVPLTPRPNCAILDLPVAEVEDPGGGENRCLFVYKSPFHPTGKGLSANLNVRV